MKGHMERLIRLNERRALNYRKNLDLNPNSRDYGALFDPVKGYIETSGDSAFHGILCLYYNDKSKHYMREETLDFGNLMMDHMLRDMNADGTIDLRETNFHDATSSAFTVRGLGLTYKIIHKYSQHTPKENELEKKILTFLERAGEGMRTGGFHTPNHRWVMSSAMSLMYTATGDQRLLDEIEKYLREGIDINEDGDYNEQSVSIYDIVTNESLIILAEELGKTELLEHVARNLNKLPCYWEADDTVNTLNSHRQDHGAKAYPTGHYWSCVYMAHKHKSPLFAAMAEHLLTVMEDQLQAADFSRFMLYPFLQEELEAGTIPQQYELYLPHSGILRYRSGDATVTLLQDNPVFFKYQYCATSVMVRMCGTFYAKGQFRAESIEKTENGYSMRYFYRWGYVRPLDAKPETNDWNILRTREREHVNMQDYEIKISVSLEGETVHIDVDADCRDANVPCKLDFMFQPGGQFETEGTLTHALAGGSLILRDGSGVYVNDCDGIRIEGGEAYHYYTRNMRGSLPVAADLFTVYTTFFTPHKHRITLFPASAVTTLPAFK